MNFTVPAFANGSLTPTQRNDDYVFGLLLALVIFSAIPFTANGALLLSILLLAIVWTPVITGKVKLS